MNLQELVEKYPEAYCKFAIWSSGKYPTFERPIEHVLFTDYEKNGLLTEFFREQKMIMLVTSDDGLTLGYEIHLTETGNIYTSFEGVYDTYEQAFESGVEKCFEILERQLSEGRK